MKTSDPNWLWKPDKWTRVCIRRGDKKVAETHKKLAENYKPKPSSNRGNG